jgi:hypothetical protein
MRQENEDSLEAQINWAIIDNRTAWAYLIQPAQAGAIDLVEPG